MLWKLTADIKNELTENGWRDDTLSPLTEKPYWDLCAQMIKADQHVRSILFAKSTPISPMQKKYVFILTEDGLFYRSDYGGYISTPKKVDLANVNVSFFKDKYLHSFIYVDFKFSFWKRINLQTFDPTGINHFQTELENLTTNKKDFKVS